MGYHGLCWTIRDYHWLPRTTKGNQGLPIGWLKNFSKLFFSHFLINWMILMKYCFVISHIVQNPAADTPNKVTNQSPAAIILRLWLVTSRPRFRSMWKITKQYINKSIQSIWKCLKYSSEKFLRQPIEEWTLYWCRQSGNERHTECLL